LVSQIRERYPHLSEEQADNYIQLLRTANNGKLSGMSIPRILEGVASLIADAREDDSECVICYDIMNDYNSKKLNPCRHRFHNHCIDNWIYSERTGTGNTCPMCRKFIVKDDEFPGLGPIGRRK